MNKCSLRSFVLSLGCALSSLCAGAQTPSAEPAFEVATVKPMPIDSAHPFTGRHYWAHVTPAGASYWTMSVDSLLVYAYGIERLQVKGPAWTDSEHFDIEARFPEGANPKDDKKMLQALMKDRFKLAFHIEKQPLEIYVLTVGKHGVKLVPSLPDPVVAEAPAKPAEAGAAAAPPKSTTTNNSDGSSTINMGKKGTWKISFDRDTWSNHFEFSKMTMEELTQKLGQCMGTGVKHVEDETGLKGTYQVAFDCLLPNPPPQPSTGAAGSAPADPQGGYSLARSLDALGLKLEPRKVMMDVYVIDHVEKPGEN